MILLRSTQIVQCVRAVATSGTLTPRHERAFRAAGSVVGGSADRDAEGLEKVLAGCRIDTSAFVEKVSGSRPGCP